MQSRKGRWSARRRFKFTPETAQKKPDDGDALQSLVEQQSNEEEEKEQRFSAKLVEIEVRCRGAAIARALLSKVVRHRGLQQGQLVLAGEQVHQQGSGCTRNC